MSLKLLGKLFTGPFDILEYRFRKNKKPSIILIIEKTGEDFDPRFKLIDFFLTKNEDFAPPYRKYNKDKLKKLTIFFKEYDNDKLDQRIKLFSQITKYSKNSSLFLDY